MLHQFFDFALNITSGLGYWGVGILMTIESSFLPFPSEIVVPPAAYLASQGEMNIFIVIIAGVVGSVLGAVINYVLSMSLGRFLVYRLAEHKFAKLIFITPAKIEKAEKYFLENSKSATFFGRLIPVIRQFVSIPAGFCRMNFWHFIMLTAAGSAIWVSILAVLGYFIGSKKEILELYYKELSYVFIVAGALYIIFKIRKYRRKKTGR